MALAAPSGLSATKINQAKINLAWTNDFSDGVYTNVLIERKISGGAYAQIASVSGTTTSYSDASCQDGTQYYYKVRGRSTTTSEYSSYSSEANATTALLAPTGLSGTATNTTVVLTWNDNCQNESGFKIYKDGAYLATVGANVTTYTATGLSEGTWYDFKVKAYNAAIDSNFSNTETILTADPPNKPSDLTVTITGTTTATLNWKDNSNNETGFKVERSSTSASAGFAQIGTVSRNVVTYADTGMVSNTQYWWRVRAYNDSGNSAYCTVATGVTWAAIAAPTNLTAVAFSGTQVDIRFTDNSELEDDHRLERKTGAGAYAEVKTMEPNRTFYRDSGLAAGTLYTYRVRAKQGGSYSGYSDEVPVTTMSVPTAPTDLEISEYQDTWLKLAWTPTTLETGYKIEQSSTGAWGGEEVEIAKISCFNLSEYKVTGLTPSAHYHFRIRAYNAAGNSAYLSDVSTDMRAAYSPSKFEKLIRRDKPRLNFHVEINPLMIISGWTDYGNDIYYAEFDERGAEIDGVWINGVEMDYSPSITTYDNTWFYDKHTHRLYIVTPDLSSPVDYLVTASFWLYFSTARGITFNDHDYLPLVAKDGIPDFTQEIQRYSGDNFVITSGTVSLINAKINGEFFFDRIFEKYIWINRKVKILAGGAGFTYTELETINTGIINAHTITDQRANFDLRDYRDGIHASLPVNKFSLDEFPLMDDRTAGQVRQVWFGTKTNIVPVCIDTTNRRFEFHNDRFKSITQITQNGTALVENTDYFVDYGIGQFVLARALAYATDDIMLVDLHGMTDTADDEITNGADIYRYMMNNWLAIPDTDLDLNSIWNTKYTLTQALAFGLWKETGSQEAVRMIEQSIMAYSFQDASGRLGLRPKEETAASDIKYIPNSHIMDYSQSKGKDDIYAAVHIYYNENPSQDKFDLLTKTINTSDWLYKVKTALDVYVALTATADADTLGALIVADLNKKKIPFIVPRTLYKNFPGDLIYITRNRFSSSSGSALNLLVRILSISKMCSSNKTGITVEIV